MKAVVKHSEAGFSLVTAVVIITLLVFLGTMVLQQVANDVQLAGGDRAAANALYIAEAGAVWGKVTATNLLFPNGPGTPQVSAITALTPVTAADQTSLCPDTAGVCTTTFYSLTAASGSTWVSYGSGQYNVGVACNPNCTGMPYTYTIRSFGQTPDGAKRLVELTLGN